MTRAQGFALLTPAQRAEVSRKGGRAAHASGHANQFTSKTARAAGLKSAARGMCGYCAHRATCVALRTGADCGPGHPLWEPAP